MSKLLLQSLRSSRTFIRCKSELTAEQKDRLRSALPNLTVQQEDRPDVAYTESVSLASGSQKDLDEIRARGFLKVREEYKPTTNVASVIEGIGQKFSLDLVTEFPSLAIKSEILVKLGEKYKHFVPNSQLHRINTLSDVTEFYQTPIENISDYAKLARDEKKPENLSIRETPVRFHPNDKHAFHKGISAFPGEGGQVVSLRNQRIYRSFRPKRDWFDFEEQNFDHEPIDKNMPWDPEVAAKMDRYTDRKFQNSGFKKL